MYRKYITGFFLAGMTILSSWLCVRELKIDRISAKPAFRMEYLDTSMEEDKKSFVEMLESVSSGQRVVDYEVLEQTKKYQLSDKDYDALLRIVEAEAGGEDQNGKLLVANVVLNRVNNELFPDTVFQVVMQKEQGIAQFSPTVDGRYQNVRVSETRWRRWSAPCTEKTFLRERCISVPAKRPIPTSSNGLTEN